MDTPLHFPLGKPVAITLPRCYDGEAEALARCSTRAHPSSISANPTPRPHKSKRCCANCAMRAPT